LWSVSDISTSLFAQHFYRLHETYSLSKSEALRLTQELFIKGQLSLQNGERIHVRGIETTENGTENSSYTHPYFWAPFVLSGNWL
jgi:CHAT domain-containing protein